MDKIKIIFFDIDGTLIDMQKKKITPRILETLTRLQDCGIRLCIAMGNASDRLKRIAADVCGPVTEDGIYTYCSEHGLI